MAKKRIKAVLTDNAAAVVSEAYRNVRTNLLFLLSSKGYKSVLFSSSLPSDGKSTTCANFALSFAQTGKRVIIVDADLRSPTIHSLIPVKHSPGLSDVLAGFSDLGSCIKPTPYENLEILPAGTIPPNPSEMLLSEEYSRLMRRLSEKFDIIFIDTPPVSLFTDAISISRQADGVVLITSYARTKKESLVRTVEKFRKVEANLLGIIVNRIKLKKYYEQVGSKIESRYLKHYEYQKR
ncbi:MAG: CpsD/CapB family tyrosine-protein kinase [Oscillospiraceae bacterium]|jgi:capsular exopolysaccharide synthesis family protein